MLHLLGRLQWIMRPMGGAVPFLARACRNICAGSLWFTHALARATGKALMLGFPKHDLAKCAAAHKCTFAMFSDAAIVDNGFQAGVVGAPGVYRTYLCPKWVKSLKKAELYAAYAATKVAVGSRLQSSLSGSTTTPHVSKGPSCGRPVIPL